jgi:Cu2+-containing amine oxidase
MLKVDDISKYYVPLTAEEIAQVADAVIQFSEKEAGSTNGDDSLQQHLRFVAISLKEPSTSDIIPMLREQQQQDEEKKNECDGTIQSPPSTVVNISRQAEVVTVHPQTGFASEYVVDIATMEVMASQVLPPGTQPMFTPDDLTMVEEMIQNSPVVAAVLKERYGIDDMTRVACDPWSINMAGDDDWALTRWQQPTSPESNPTARLVQVFLYHRQHGKCLEDNHYAHPIDIVPIIDINAHQLVQIEGIDRVPAPPYPPIRSSIIVICCPPTRIWKPRGGMMY